MGQGLLAKLVPVLSGVLGALNLEDRRLGVVLRGVGGNLGPFVRSVVQHRCSSC